MNAEALAPAAGRQGDDLVKRGVAILMRELGVVETARFLARVGPPGGNYTEERRARYDAMSRAEVLAVIEEHERQHPRS